MFRTFAVAAFVAVATATTWPMITVNSAGEIVLNSVSRASSFQLTPMSVTAGPTSTTTASLTTVTALDDNVDTYIVTVPTTLATSGGFKLPTPTVGRKITLFNDGTAPAAFTVWSSATTVFFGTTTSTTHVVPSTATWTTFIATDTTNWAVYSSEGSSKNLQTIGTGSSATITLSEAELLGGFYTFTGTAASTITTPTGSALEIYNTNARVGDSFEFTIHNTGSAAATLTAGASGITFTDDAIVSPGDRVSFRVLRTAASTYTLWRKASEANRVQVFTKTAAFSPTAAESGAVYYVANTAAIAVTLPTCSAANSGVTYGFAVNAALANTVAVTAAGTDAIFGYADAAGVGDASSIGALGGTFTIISAAIIPTPVAATAAATANLQITCLGNNLWYGNGFGAANTIIA